MSKFHWKDDVYFERLYNGDMKVFKTLGGPDGVELFDIVVPAREWCAIISQCSAMPSDQTFRYIEQVHLGKK